LVVYPSSDSKVKEGILDLIEEDQDNEDPGTSGDCIKNIKNFSFSDDEPPKVAPQSSEDPTPSPIKLQDVGKSAERHESSVEAPYDDRNLFS
jgi:hypothetical protein